LLETVPRGPEVRHLVRSTHPCDDHEGFMSDSSQSQPPTPPGGFPPASPATPQQPPTPGYGMPQPWHAPSIVTDQHTNVLALIIAWAVALVSLGYMLPWAIAATRGKSNATAIAVVNLLTGWTFVGWIVALVMACGAHQTTYAGTVNVSVAQHVPAQPLPHAGPSAGWYAAPDGSGEAFWDGQQWTGQRRP
jgi:hypothetical protein